MTHSQVKFFACSKIIEKIASDLSAQPNLRNLVVIIPSYKVAEDISKQILSFKGYSSLVLPKFTTFYDLPVNTLELSNFAKNLKVIDHSNTNKLDNLLSQALTLKQFNLDLKNLEIFSKQEAKNKFPKLFASYHEMLEKFDLPNLDNLLKALSLSDIHGAENLYILLPNEITDIEKNLCHYFNGCKIFVPYNDVFLHEFSFINSSLQSLEKLKFKMFGGEYYEQDNFMEAPACSLVEASNIYEEAQKIAKIIAQELGKESQTISILTIDESLRKLIINALNNLLGVDMLFTKLSDALPFKLLISLLEYINEPNLSKLQNLLHSSTLKAEFLLKELELKVKEIKVNSIEDLTKFLDQNSEISNLIKSLKNLNSETNTKKFYNKLLAEYNKIFDLGDIDSRIKAKLFELFHYTATAKIEARLSLEEQINLLIRLASGMRIADILPNVEFLDLADLTFQTTEVIIYSDIGFNSRFADLPEKQLHLYSSLVQLFKCKNIYFSRNRTNQESPFFTVIKKFKNLTHLEFHSPILEITPINRPNIKVTSSAKPLKYSVTAIEKLMRDPYSYYAEYILKLREYESPFEFNYYKEFGIVVHNILSKAITHSANSLEDFVHNGLQVFENNIIHLNLDWPNHYIWRYRMLNILSWIYENIDVKNSKTHTEIDGEISLKVKEQDIFVRARADYAYYTPDSNLVMVDFKTGSSPSRKNVENGLYPQLPIEKLIAESGGYSSLEATSDVFLKYFEIKGRKGTGQIHSITSDSPKTLESLKGLFEAVFSDNFSYFAAKFNGNLDSKVAGYKHLRREDEWFDFS